MPHPLLIEYKKIREKKKEALSRPILTKIKKELDNYREQVSIWLSNVNNTIRERQEKFWRLKKLLQQYQDKIPLEIIKDLNKIANEEIKFDSISVVSLDELTGILQRFDDMERRVEGALKGLLSDEEREIIERGDKLEKLRIEMGEESFWKTLRGVIQKIPSLTIQLEWREGK